MTSTVAYLLLAPLLTVLGLYTPPAPEAAVWPLSPRPELVEGFSPPEEEWGAGHRGVDLLGSAGQSVRAAQAGTVTFAGLLAGRGVVVVTHGSTRTTYEPVDAVVAVGDHVRAGQRIGTLGTFGSHCWPRSCLHWGLLEGETYLNPLTLVGAGPVRLLPLYSAFPGASTPPRWPHGPPPGPLADPWSRVVRPAGVPAGTPGVAGPW
jgi:murein DD-endopeptidase MepM/ murein hydrolase activator NlpD